MPRIYFTRPQAAAMQHRLDLWDSFAEVFAQTKGYEHLAPFAADRAHALATQLGRCGYVDANNDGIDREILREAVEGSTWPAVHNPHGGEVSQQAYDGAARALWNAWVRVAQAYGLNAHDVNFPQG